MSSISIVIVNYNSKAFLELSLFSVQKALKSIDAEVFVVDNASSDNSREYITPKYPCVKWIQNDTNVGFAKANNQAISLATKRYVLLLNPDTIVPEDCFTKTLEFMESHEECGALGVKMVDGSGNYLPESKRGLPTPSVSFFKLSGLHNICPKNRQCSKYYMGHIHRDSVAKVEVLSGAFMLIRRKAISRVGLLDEGYFMYGEDIDYSYRILLGGYLNYYFPEVTIIHFKGESTQVNTFYVKVFYDAMKRFATQYFKHNLAFYYCFQPALYVISRFAMARAYLQSNLRNLMPNDKLPKKAKVIIVGDKESAHKAIESFIPKTTVLENPNKTNCLSVTIVDTASVNFKEFIQSLSSNRGTIYFMAPQNNFLLKSAHAKKIGRVFTLQ